MRLALGCVVHLLDSKIDLRYTLALLTRGNADFCHCYRHALYSIDDLDDFCARARRKRAAFVDAGHRLVDQRFDLFGCGSAPLRQCTTLPCHDCESTPLLAGTHAFITTS